MTEHADREDGFLLIEFRACNAAYQVVTVFQVTVQGSVNNLRHEEIAHQLPYILLSHNRICYSSAYISAQSIFVIVF